MNDKPLKVLAADDEYWIRENLRTIIDWQALGLELLPMAQDGEDALRKMEESPADIVITDINMPYISGVELMEQFKSRWPETAILVLSGYSDFEYVHKALLCGALTVSASALTFTDAHGNVIELDDSLEAYTNHVLYGADDAARRKAEI